MAEELATLPKTPALPTKGRIGMAEALGVSEPFMTRKAELQPKISAAEGDIAKAQQAQQETLSTGKTKAMQQYGTETEAAQKAYEGKLEAEPLPAFVPTKDTMQDIAGLFSVISVIGALVGGSGKMAAQRSMGAMNGMMEGYRKGKADQYKQERNQFDANFKTMIQKHSEFRKEMEDAVRLASTNKEAGFQAAELAATKAGSDIVKAQLRKGDLMGAYKLVDESQKGANEAVKLEQKARAEEEKARQHRADMAQRERQQRETMAQRERLATIKAGGGIGGKPEKTPSDVEKSVRQNALFLSNIEGIVSEADKLIKEGNIRGIGVIQGKIPYDVAQLYMTKAERDFLQDFNALTNQKLKDQSGATVTGAEFARQRGVLPLRDDDPKVILDKLKNWERLIAQETSVYGRAYPGVIRKYGITLDMPSDKSKLVPGLEYKTPRGTMLWDGSNFLEPSGE